VIPISQTPGGKPCSGARAWISPISLPSLSTTRLQEAAVVERRVTLDLRP